MTEQNEILFHLFVAFIFISFSWLLFVFALISILVSRFAIHLFHFHLSLLGRIGSPQYLAPEVVSRRVYGKGCDVWGAGIMLHVLLSGRLPFLGSGKRLHSIISQGRIVVSRFSSVNFASFANWSILFSISFMKNEA